MKMSNICEENLVTKYSGEYGAQVLQWGGARWCSFKRHQLGRWHLRARSWNLQAFLDEKSHLVQLVPPVLTPERGVAQFIPDEPPSFALPYRIWLGVYVFEPSNIAIHDRARAAGSYFSTQYLFSLWIC
jgi:hypothetical protein